MTYPIVLSQGWSKFADEVDAELKRARTKFPKSFLLTTALTEEHGEAIRAVLEHYYASEKGGVSEKDLAKLRAEVRKELVQTAAMCIRLALEGDPIHCLPGAGE